MKSHPLKLHILRNLLFAHSLTYTGLKRGLDVENNKLSFHLNDLLAGGYVLKNGSRYQLSAAGKEYAGRVDTDKLEMTKQAKISAWVCCTRGNGKNKEFLIYTRLKQPFFGCQGFMSGKVPYGEMVMAAALRELREETNLSGKVELVELKHYRVFDETSNALLEDKFMFLMLVKDPVGELKSNNEGMFEWVPKQRLRDYVTNPFEDAAAFRQQIEDIESFSGMMRFVEVDHWSHKF